MPTFAPTPDTERPLADYDIRLKQLTPNIFGVVLTNKLPLLSLRFDVVGCRNCSDATARKAEAVTINNKGEVVGSKLNFRLSDMKAGHIFAFSEEVGEAIPTGTSKVLCYLKFKTASANYCIAGGRCIDRDHKARHLTQRYCIKAKRFRSGGGGGA